MVPKPIDSNTKGNFFIHLSKSKCIFWVKELLGHKDIKMALRYPHLAPEHKQKAVSVLDNIFSKQSKTAEIK
jgi:integrase